MGKQDKKGHDTKKKASKPEDDDEDDEDEDTDTGTDDDADTDDDDADDESDDTDDDDESDDSDDDTSDDDDDDEDDAEEVVAKKPKPKKKKKAESSDDGDEDADEDGEEVEEHGEKDVSSALAALDDDEWADTEEQGFGDVPDNNYFVKIEAAPINHAKSSGRLQVSWDLVIVGDADGTKSEFNGRHLFNHAGINNAESRGWFKSGLTKLGAEWPKSPKDLPKVLEDLIGSYAEVRCKTKESSDRQSVYFVRAVDESEIPADSDDDSESSDDDEAEEVVEEKPKKKKKESAPPKDEPKVEIKFAVEKANKYKDELIKLAKANKIEPKDYKENWADLMGDLAEYLGLSGEFETAKGLMRRIQEQAAK